MPETPDAALFEAGDLSEWIGKTITADRGQVLERVVWGWLKPRLGLEERPTPVPAEVFSWAIELGAIAHENPAGLSGKQLGSNSRQYSAERRGEILDEAEAYSGGGSGAPMGTFPDPLPYPDPAEGPRVLGW